MMTAPRSPFLTAPPGETQAGLLWIGLAALACYATHATRQFIHDRPENLLWTCHAAVAIVGVGSLLRSRDLVAAGALLLTVGLPIWTIDLATGSELFFTSVLTHVGGFSLAMMALRRLGGFPQHAGWYAMLIVTMLIAISRLVTSPTTNVNFAFESWTPFAAYLPNGPAHLSFLLAQWAILLILARWLVSRLCAYAN